MIVLFLYGHEKKVLDEIWWNYFIFKVQYDVDGDGRWSECFDVAGVELPTGYYLGLSAGTGDLAGQ